MGVDNNEPFRRRPLFLLSRLPANSLFVRRLLANGAVSSLLVEKRVFEAASNLFFRQFAQHIGGERKENEERSPYADGRRA